MADLKGTLARKLTLSDAAVLIAPVDGAKRQGPDR
jgi:hypothetical protein